MLTIAAALSPAAALAGMAPRGASPASAAATGRGAESASRILPTTSDHRYRVTGEIRLLLIWVGSDRVGGARITRRAHPEGARVLSLLIGSDPEQAPRQLNEWGYIREEARADRTDIFGVRRTTDADSVRDAASLADRADTMTFATLCSSVNPTHATSSVARLSVPADVTFRRFERVLDGLADAGSGNATVVVKPADAAPGFLTAVERLIARTLEAGDSRHSPAAIQAHSDGSLAQSHTRPLPASEDRDEGDHQVRADVRH